MSFLPVRIDGIGWSKNVTQYASRLSFAQTAPGGYTRMRVNLTLPPEALPDLGPACRALVTDPHTGDTLWEGWAEYPGEKQTSRGASWSMAAVGTWVHAYDQAKSVGYLDRELNRWSPARTATMPEDATAEVGTDPRGSGADGLFVGFLKGVEVGTLFQSSLGYTRLYEIGMQVGGISVTVSAGRNDEEYRAQLTWTDGTTNGSGNLGSDNRIFTDPTRSTRVIGGASPPHPPAGVDRIALRLYRVAGSGPASNNTVWLWMTDPVVLGRRVNRYGVLLSGNDVGSTEYVRADWIVEDVIGRYLPLVGAEMARVDAPALPFQIDQLFFDEPTRAGDILDALTMWQPDMLWEILHTVEGRGLVFNYRPWALPADTHPGEGHRYELSTTRDAIELTGSDEDLCDRIAVAYTDSRGRAQSRTVTITVPQLIASGRTPHDAEAIELPAGLGSAANAQRAGEQVLAAINMLPLNGTGTITRPVYDRLTGLTVAPHEIQPGYLALIREKGEVVRLTETEYDDDTRSCKVTLGSPRKTRDQIIATLGSRAKRRRS